ncbi:MAG: hypothetical protein ACPGLY_04780 [Rubripirellula sp.]
MGAEVMFEYRDFCQQQAIKEMLALILNVAVALCVRKTHYRL